MHFQQSAKGRANLGGDKIFLDLLKRGGEKMTFLGMFVFFCVSGLKIVNALRGRGAKIVQ